jgi:hypothetical protein
MTSIVIMGIKIKITDFLFFEKVLKLKVGLIPIEEM